jgi:cystathionine beta-lyase/cystathionine gamma-synthase
MTSKMKRIVYCTLRMFLGQGFAPFVSEVGLNGMKSLVARCEQINKNTTMLATFGCRIR